MKKYIFIVGFPLIQGLSYTYGVSTIPGTLVDNIYVSKGKLFKVTKLDEQNISRYWQELF